LRITVSYQFSLAFSLRITKFGREPFIYSFAEMADYAKIVTIGDGAVVCHTLLLALFLSPSPCSHVEFGEGVGMFGREEEEGDGVGEEGAGGGVGGEEREEEGRGGGEIA
jgi:hypothetical protein